MLQPAQMRGPSLVCLAVSAQPSAALASHRSSRSEGQLQVTSVLLLGRSRMLSCMELYSALKLTCCPLLFHMLFTIFLNAHVFLRPQV